MSKKLHLRPEFAIQCDGQEYVDEESQRYEIAIVARGVILLPDGAWGTERSLIKGFAIARGRQHWIDEDRPVLFAWGMNRDDAFIVLDAVFRHLKCGQLHGGDLTIMPIDLKSWLDENVHVSVAHTVERALRAAVMAINDVAKN